MVVVHASYPSTQEAAWQQVKQNGTRVIPAEGMGTAGSGELSGQHTYYNQGPLGQ